ncbi:MAG TPA: TonB family protein, partial [Methylovirgula sp.]
RNPFASDLTFTVAPRAPTTDETLIADPRDRFFAPIDPLLRNAKKRFGAIIVFACLLHVVLLILLLARDHSTKTAMQETQIPVEVIVMPPPQQPKPPPPQQQKPQPKEKEKVLKNEVARDTPPPANQEKQQTKPTDKASASPLQNKPVPNTELKPVPNPQQEAARNAAMQPAERTVAPDETKDKPDAEPLNKAAPVKDQKTEEKQKPAKDKSPLPDSEKQALAREFASLTEAPKFAVASEAKPSPISGGQCHANTYLCTLFGLIMRQQHYPEVARAAHIEGTVVVAFWVDERGDLVHQALYRTSGHQILDDEAIASIRRAAPFPPPPPNIPHGFIASMEFPPK